MGQELRDSGPGLSASASIQNPCPELSGLILPCLLYQNSQLYELSPDKICPSLRSQPGNFVVLLPGTSSATARFSVSLGASICSLGLTWPGVDITHSPSLAVLLNPAPAPFIICPFGFCHAPGGPDLSWTLLVCQPQPPHGPGQGCLHCSLHSRSCCLHHVCKSSTQVLSGFPCRPSRDLRISCI